MRPAVRLAPTLDASCTLSTQPEACRKDCNGMTRRSHPAETPVRARPRRTRKDKALLRLGRQLPDLDRFDRDLRSLGAEHAHRVVDLRIVALMLIAELSIDIDGLLL